MSFGLRGRAALVTGGAQGIGLATARALHARGARVALADLDAERTQSAAASIAPEVLALAADVTDTDRMRAVVDEVVERLGGLDVVVANAGIAPPPGSVRAMDPEAFERVVDVDLLGVYRTVHPALPHVIAARGHVVVVASVYAFMNGMGAAPYAMAKAGVEQLGRTLRAELSIHGASATTAYFGFIDTAMVQDTIDKSPLRDALQAAVPGPLLKRLPPGDAGEGIVRGIERRAPRVILPRRWAVLSALRGVIGPVLDDLSAKHAPVQDLLRRLDA